MKKILKLSLILSLFASVFSGTLVRASDEIQPYASNSQVESHYVVVNNPINKGFDLRINYKLLRVNTGVEETLDFYGFTSTTITSGYTFAPSKAMSAVGYSSSIDANKILIITYAVKTYKNGTYLGTVDITITYKLNRTPTVSVG